MSSELDILIVGYSEERFSTEIRQAFRHWQVYSVSSPHALHGRRFRRAYATQGAIDHPAWLRLNSMLVAACDLVGGEVVRFSEYHPEYAVQTADEAELHRAIRRSRHPVS